MYFGMKGEKERGGTVVCGEEVDPRPNKAKRRGEERERMIHRGKRRRGWRADLSQATCQGRNIINTLEKKRTEILWQSIQKSRLGINDSSAPFLPPLLSKDTTTIGKQTKG